MLFEVVIETRSGCPLIVNVGNTSPMFPCFYLYGTTKLYAEITFEVAREKGLLGQRLHLDSTSFTLYGHYDVEGPEDAPTSTYGNSKAHRPDLKQVMV